MKELIETILMGIGISCILCGIIYGLLWLAICSNTYDDTKLLDKDKKELR